MKKSFDYREESRLCLAAAENAVSPDNRRFLLAMARIWANLAGDDAPIENSPPVRPAEGGASADPRSIS